MSTEEKLRWFRDDKGTKVSELHVMMTCGYYLGRVCIDPDYGFEEPYSRESGYYLTREAADKALESGGFERDCLENTFTLVSEH